MLNMKSAYQDVLPGGVRRSLSKFGRDLSIARRKRRLTIAMLAERIGVSKGTYSRIERGDPTVALGAYAMALFVLGFGEAFDELADVRGDDHGLILDEERLPQRVRVKKSSAAL